MSDASKVIQHEIIAIMDEYDRQMAERGDVDTPGGLEHMGDVWRLFGRWKDMLQTENFEETSDE